MDELALRMTSRFVDSSCVARVSFGTKPKQEKNAVLSTQYGTYRARAEHLYLNLCDSFAESGSTSDSFELLPVRIRVHVELLCQELDLLFAERRPHPLRLRLLARGSIVCNTNDVTRSISSMPVTWSSIVSC